MTDRPYRGKIDHARLGQYLRVLSVPTRILLLQKLQVPQTSSEIRLPPFRQDGRLDPQRSISRQAVEGHLAQLAEVGLVRSRSAKRGARSVEEWVVNQAKLFTVVDELRRLALIRATSPLLTAGTAGAFTGTPALPLAPDLPEGPCLILVSGPQEGRALPLLGKGPWTIGREKGAAEIAIPHDPYVSAANTRIRRNDEGLLLENLRSSRNGTTHNWRLMAAEELVALSGGDTIGVGRSLLVFRDGGR